MVGIPTGIYSTVKLVDSQLMPTATRAQACDRKPPCDMGRWLKLSLLKAACPTP